MARAFFWLHEIARPTGELRPSFQLPYPVFTFLRFFRNEQISYHKIKSISELLKCIKSFICKTRKKRVENGYEGLPDPPMSQEKILKSGTVPRGTKRENGDCRQRVNKLGKLTLVRTSSSIESCRRT